MEYLSVLNLNMGKYGAEKLQIPTLFMIPYELRMIIIGNKAIPANISKLSERAAYSQFFFP